ncbi:MAG: hypothetical protein RBS80_04625 [Thermoguttaceae bacterium]|nr:hypothetical protein [Thermoguttaceae bacterium]
MLCDDRLSHPMVGFGRLRFSGHLDRNALEAAFSEALPRHVLLRCSIQRNRRGRPVWIEHTDWNPGVEWCTANGEREFPQSSRADIGNAPGTRLWAIDRGPGHDLILQVHHCAADATGISQVMEDLLIGYALRRGGAPDVAVLPPMDTQRLQRRGTPGLTPLRWLGMAHRQAVGLLGVREFLSRRPVPLMGTKVPFDESSPPESFPCPRIVELEAEETGRLLAVAKTLGATVNDLLMRDLFLALTAWRAELSLGSDQDWLRVTVPMNLRTPADVCMPMANSVSMVFADRRGMDASDPSILLDGICRQMNLIKKCRLQYTFLASLAAARRLPGGLASRTRAEVVQSTSCFSNIGVALARTPLPRREGRLVAGDVELESVDFVIPLRPHLHGAFCAYTYAGRLRILLHHDPRAMADDLAEGLLDRFLRQIRQTLAAGR